MFQGLQGNLKANCSACILRFPYLLVTQKQKLRKLKQNRPKASKTNEESINKYRV